MYDYFMFAERCSTSLERLLRILQSKSVGKSGFVTFQNRKSKFTEETENSCNLYLDHVVCIQIKFEFLKRELIYMGHVTWPQTVFNEFLTELKNKKKRSNNRFQ